MKKNYRKPYGSTGYKAARQVTLDDNTVDVLTVFGNGNLSLGVRLAAAYISDWQDYNDLPPPPATKCFVL